MMPILSETNIAECQSKFNLSYHVNFAYQCQQTIGFAGKDVLEVGGSLPEEFVLDYLQVRSWSAIETPEYDESLADVGGSPHQGTAFKDIIRTDRASLGFQNRTLDRYNLFLGKVEELPREYFQKYDLVFSIAAFEHIHKLPQALEKMYAALKPGGKLFSMFSPIWSAYDGHHLPAITDKNGTQMTRAQNCPIPPWGHLTMRPPDLSRYLYRSLDRETADTIVYYVYNCDHINRFFSEDYINFIEQSPFRSLQVQPIFSSPLSPEMQQQLERLYPGRSQFSNNGFRVILERPLEEDDRKDENARSRPSIYTVF